MPRLEASKMGRDAVERDRKAAEPVAVGADEIGEAHIGAAFALGDLLAQEGDADVPFLFDKVDDDIVALAPARPQPGDAARVKPAFRDDPAQHLARVGEQVAGAFADDLVVEDRGIDAGEFPGEKEGRPVEPTIGKHTSELPSLMRNSYAVFCLKKKKTK